MNKDRLVFVGKIIELSSIPTADFIVSATVVCGEGGKWRGVVKKCDFNLGDLCLVFLPDSLVPRSDQFSFMKATDWRVKMRKFKGAPSEVLIMPYAMIFPIGTDVTDHLGVLKYHKPVPAHLQGTHKGEFPSFMPKTDEPNYQGCPELVDALVGKPWYMTEKCDGSSTTAYRYKGNFGLCSRNWELERDETNGYWKVALAHRLEETLPEGIALQWETCGPGIQSNPMNLPEIEGFAFNAYNILDQKHLDLVEFLSLCRHISFPTVRVLFKGLSFDKEGIETLGEGLYEKRTPREGVVVRSQENFGHKPISFKVINLGYEK